MSVIFWNAVMRFELEYLERADLKNLMAFVISRASAVDPSSMWLALARACKRSSLTRIYYFTFFPLLTTLEGSLPIQCFAMNEPIEGADMARAKEPGPVAASTSDFLKKYFLPPRSI